MSTFATMAISHFRLFLRLAKESVLFALDALRVNKLRTILSLLGITIGIFAIISVFTVTDALERKIRKDVESLGSSVIYVQKWPWVPEGGEEYPWWKYLSRPPRIQRNARPQPSIIGSLGCCLCSIYRKSNCKK
jgi:ABC-type lipoprotein release transport system permease subunit